MNKQTNSEIWESRAVNAGNFFTRRPIIATLLAFFALGALGFGIKMILAPVQFANQAAQVMQQEFNPHAMLKKYEWFKDTAAALTAKRHDIKILEARLIPLRMMDRKDMDRQDKQDLAQYEAELAGVAMMYNSLASRYNSQLSKFNWQSFQSSLPYGANEILSKEFAPYTNGDTYE